MDNQVNIEFTPELISSIDTAITGLKDALKPHLVAIPSDKKKNMVVVAERLFDFIEKGIMLSDQNPTLTPPYLKMEDIKKDADAWRQLTHITKELEQILSLLNDTAAVCGNEAYNSTRSFYHYIKQAAKDGVPGAKPVYEEMKKQFPTGGTKKNNGEETVEEDNI